MTIGAGIGAVTGLAGARAGWGLLLAFPGAFWGSLASAHSDQYTTLYDTTALTLTTPQLSLSSTPATTSPASTSVPDFSAADVKVGQFVYVSDPEAKIEVSGRVTLITPSRIEIGAYAVEPKPGLKIERKGDTIWDGAAIGFLAGGLAGVTVGREGCLNTTGTRCFFDGGLAGAVLGAYLDWRHVGRTTIFVASPNNAAHSTRLIPSITPRARSVLLQFTF